MADRERFSREVAMPRRSAESRRKTPVPRPSAPSPVSRVLMGALLLSAPVVLLLEFTINPLTGADMWFHAKTGELIWKLRSLPPTDPFTILGENRPWIINAWLSDLFFWRIFVLGPVAPTLTTAAFAFLAFLMVLAWWRRIGAPTDMALVAISVAIVAAGFRFSPRPELFSAVLASALLLIYLEAKYTPKSRLFLIPLVLLLWANLHMGFVNGVGMLAVLIGGELLSRALPRWSSLTPPMAPRRFRALIAASILGTASTLLNPYGLRAWSYTGLVAGSPIYRDLITEWEPLFGRTPVNPVSLTALALLALGALGAMGFRRRVPLPTLLLSLATGALTIAVQRQALFFDFAVCALLAETLRAEDRSALEPTRLREAAFGVLAAGLLLGAVLIKLYGVPEYMGPERVLRVGVSPYVIPQKAADFIEEKLPPLRFFNSLEAGGYLTWRLYPRGKVFIDGRVDLYEPKSLRQYCDALYLSLGAEELLERYRIEACFLNMPLPGTDRQAHLATTLLDRPDWSLIYWDDKCLIFLRDLPKNRTAIARYSYRYVNPLSSRQMEEGLLRQDYTRIETELRRALEQHPENPVVRIQVGLFYRKMGDYARARRELLTGRKLDRLGIYRKPVDDALESMEGR